MLDDEAEVYGTLALGLADPFVEVDELDGGWSSAEDYRPALAVMDGLDERVADLATGSEVVLVFGQGGDARHFIAHVTCSRRT